MDKTDHITQQSIDDSERYTLEHKYDALMEDQSEEITRLKEQNAALRDALGRSRMWLTTYIGEQGLINPLGSPAIIEIDKAIKEKGGGKGPTEAG